MANSQMPEEAAAIHAGLGELAACVAHVAGAADGPLTAQTDAALAAIATCSRAAAVAAADGVTPAARTVPRYELVGEAWDDHEEVYNLYPRRSGSDRKMFKMRELRGASVVRMSTVCSFVGSSTRTG